MTPALRLARASLSLLAFTLVPVQAHAAPGMNISWNFCAGEGLGVQNLTFACATNLGTRSLVGSFVLASAMPQVVGTEIILQLAADSPTLPAWWQFTNTGSCRQSALGAVSLFDPVNVVCVDWANEQSFTGIGAYCTVDHPCLNAPPSANTAVIKVINAVAPVAAQDLVEDVEYYDFTLRISNQKTLGTAGCTGCTVPVCIVLNSINVVAKDNAEQRFISTSTAPGSNFVTWQGGGGGVTGCPAATPTRRSTWGAVKTLYR